MGDRQRLQDLGGEAKACGLGFQNLDMGTDHMALVSLAQRISAVSNSNLAGGDQNFGPVYYMGPAAQDTLFLLGIQSVLLHSDSPLRHPMGTVAQEVR